jgi:hypothetical protein
VRIDAVDSHQCVRQQFGHVPGVRRREMINLMAATGAGGDDDGVAGL